MRVAERLGLHCRDFRVVIVTIIATLNLGCGNNGERNALGVIADTSLITIEREREDEDAMREVAIEFTHVEDAINN